MFTLRDSLGRQFQYLRLSVTDVCNFRCVYCLPNGYTKDPKAEYPLTVSEIGNLVSAFAEMGFWKVRLTGGEPTVRADIVEIAREVARVPGIRKVAISTNAYRLKQLAAPLREAGVSAFNISVDSLDPERFAAITGTQRLEDVRAGVDAALEAGVRDLKINTVLMRGLNDSEKDLAAFQDWVRHAPISVRFIELMRTGDNRKLFEDHHVSAGELRLRLLRSGWRIKERSQGDGPAVEFEHPEYRGRIGLIAPYAEGFCSTCNRLRVSSRGALKLCLFGEGEFSLRPLLQSPSQKMELIGAVQAILRKKAPSHYLHEGNYGTTRHLASIGG